MAGKLPKADSAILLDSRHHKRSQMSGMDEKQSSGLLVLESSSDVHTPWETPQHPNLLRVSGALTSMRVLRSSEFLMKI